MRYVVLAFAGLWATCALAATPRLINYQGALMDTQGQPLSGEHMIVFAIYADATGTSALWTESHQAVTVDRGVFNVILGGTVPLTDELFSAAERWIGIKVDQNPEISPRSQLTAVPWALRAAIADNGEGGDSLWQTDGTNIWRETGNVGIGTVNPLRKLQIGSGLGIEEASGSPNAGAIRFGDGTGWRLHFGRTREGAGGVLNVGTAGVFMTLRDNGNVGLNTLAPNYTLDISGRQRVQGNGGLLKLEGTDHCYIEYYPDGFAAGRKGYLGFPTASSHNITIGNEFSDGLVVLQAARTKVNVIEITGADLVESFEIGNQVCDPGTVVVIDPNRPGKLRPSSGTYDTKVAGVVSGAGNLSAGIRMGEGSGLGGDTPVAMTGRVYVKCTAANGAINPGDLLTTSNIAGHAMKATNRDRLAGSVLGKAMTSLEVGEGLVLVLVNLQ